MYYEYDTVTAQIAHLRNLANDYFNDNPDSASGKDLADAAESLERLASQVQSLQAEPVDFSEVMQTGFTA